MRPPYADSGIMPDWDPNPQIHDAAGIEKMRAAGKLAAEVRSHFARRSLSAGQRQPG
jgi:methionyl aminopeptidase